MDLAHDRLGSGEPLVLLHGLGSERRAFEPVVDRLATEREVLSVDLPGLGESAPLPAGVPATPAELARAVAAFLDGAGLPAVHLAGNSLGGWVSLELAKLGRARSVTAVSPAGFWSPRELAWCRAPAGRWPTPRGSSARSATRSPAGSPAATAYAFP